MDRDIRILALAAAAAAILAPALAAAQAPQAQTPVTPKAAQVDPEACANGHATVGEGGGISVQKQPA